MKTWTIKVPPELDAKVARLARRRGASRSQIVREALERLLDEPAESMVDRAGKLVGSVSGPEDLASNPRHLEGFGE